MYERNKLHPGLILVLLLLCSIGAIANIITVRDWGDQLSPVDPYSEANQIRETHEFLDRGLWVNHGLGNVLYGNLYPKFGFAADADGRAGHLEPDGVYTHYPPGPEYILYVSMKLLGPTPVSRLRIVPIVVGWLATIYFGLSLARRFGLGASMVVIVACTTLTPFYDAFTDLHLIGYACALLLVEIGICFGFNTMIVPFACLGFVQGWLSFDYGFLVIFTPLAIEVSLPALCPGTTPRLRLALWRVLAAGTGFVAAHLLHFAEVVAYFGTLQAALHDMRSVAANRSGEGSSGALAYLLATARVLYLYWFGDIVWPLTLVVPRVGPNQRFILQNPRALHFLSFSLGAWWLALTGFLAISGSSFIQRPAWATDRLLRDWLVTSMCGVLTCSLWLIVMNNHAVVHQHLLFRHMFLAFLLMALFVINRIPRRA